MIRSFSSAVTQSFGRLSSVVAGRSNAIGSLVPKWESRTTAPWAFFGIGGALFASCRHGEPYRRHPSLIGGRFIVLGRLQKRKSLLKMSSIIVGMATNFIRRRSTRHVT